MGHATTLRSDTNLVADAVVLVAVAVVTEESEPLATRAVRVHAETRLLRSGER
jgi:hypothetical protein